MNRYPLWKYLLIAAALVFGLVYTLPNFFGEAPAVQVSSGKATLKIDSGMLARVEATLSKAGIPADGLVFDANSVKARFRDTDTQLKAKDILTRELNPDPALVRYLSSANPYGFQPMNANWGLVPDVEKRRGVSRKERREQMYDLGLEAFTSWLAEVAPWAPGAGAEPASVVGAA